MADGSHFDDLDRLIADLRNLDRYVLPEGVTGPDGAVIDRDAAKAARALQELRAALNSAEKRVRDQHRDITTDGTMAARQAEQEADEADARASFYKGRALIAERVASALRGVLWRECVALLSSFGLACWPLYEFMRTRGYSDPMHPLLPAVAVVAVACFGLLVWAIVKRKHLPPAPVPEYSPAPNGKDEICRRVHWADGEAIIAEGQMRVRVGDTHFRTAKSDFGLVIVELS